MNKVVKEEDSALMKKMEELKRTANRIYEYKRTGFYEQEAAERVAFNKQVEEINKAKFTIARELEASAKRMKIYKREGRYDLEAEEHAYFNAQMGEVQFFEAEKISIKSKLVEIDEKEELNQLSDFSIEEVGKELEVKMNKQTEDDELAKAFGVAKLNDSENNKNQSKKKESISKKNKKISEIECILNKGIYLIKYDNGRVEEYKPKRYVKKLGKPAEEYLLEKYSVLREVENGIDPYIVDLLHRVIPSEDITQVNGEYLAGLQKFNVVYTDDVDLTAHKIKAHKTKMNIFEKIYMKSMSKQQKIRSDIKYRKDNRNIFEKIADKGFTFIGKKPKFAEVAKEVVSTSNNEKPISRYIVDSDNINRSEQKTRNDYECKKLGVER